MSGKQIDRKSSKQIRIDAEMLRLLKIKAAMQQTSIKGLIEDYVAEILKDETAGKEIKY